MNKFIVLVVVAAVFIEGYAAASINLPVNEDQVPDNGDQVERIQKREASPFANLSPFSSDFSEQLQSAINAGQKAGGNFYRSSSIIRSGVDANGNPISSGTEITNDNGKITRRNF